MKAFLHIVGEDLKKLARYRIISIVAILSVLFGAILIFFPDLDPAIIIYVTIFVMPVIVFSIDLTTDESEDTLASKDKPDAGPYLVLGAKISASLILLLLPIAIYAIVLGMFRQYEMSYSLFILTCLFSSLIHILIGLSLAIISKDYRMLPLNYIVYIVVFCAAPIFFSAGIIPNKYEYLMLFSPAFLSGVLTDNILVGYAYSDTWLLVISPLLLALWGALLTIFVVFPFFKNYLKEKSNVGFQQKGGRS